MFIIYDVKSARIFTASNKDDTVVPGGHVKAVITGSLGGYNWPAHPSQCLYDPDSGQITALHNAGTSLLLEGAPAIAADPAEFGAYRIQKKDKNGDDMTGDNDNDIVSIFTSGGTLDKMEVTLVRGAGTFKLNATPETVVINIRVIAADIMGGGKQVRFMPIGG